MNTNKNIDKIIVFVLCAITYLQYNADEYFIVSIIFAVIISALMSLREDMTLNIVLYIAFCVCAVIFTPMLFFLPLICYDILLTDRKYWILCGLIPLFLGFSAIDALNCVLIILYTALSYFIKLRTISFEKAKKEYISVRDTAKEITLQLESKNKELMEKQDYEINIATLNERNRIARDIHDSIGHLLSNAILQTGAMLAICRDENTLGMLSTLKDTLTDGMNSVRNSIHGLYDDSVDLFTEVKTITDNFDFCEISFDYDIDGNPDKKVKYAMLYIIKESLSNVMKHSNASSVRLSLKEHPALYQLIVKDNGTKIEASADGIGLKNIETRVTGLGGLANFSFNNGFVVFASIPKERTI